MNNRKILFTLKFGTPTPEYPLGVPQDITVSGDGTGTPWIAAIIKDYEAFFQGVLSRAGVTASGVADTALVSDVFDSLDILYGAMLMDQKSGLITVGVDGTNEITTTAGKVRNQANTINLELPADINKDGSLLWAEGDTNGGLAENVLLFADTDYRRFLVNKEFPLVGADIVWDTDIVAANFFGSAAAAAAGYTDPSLYRRVAWEYSLSGGAWAHRINLPQDPNNHLWKLTPDVVQTASFSSRTAMKIPNSAPNTIVYGTMEYLYQSGSFVNFLKFTIEEQSDDPVTASNIGQLRVFSLDEGEKSETYGELKVSAAKEIFHREGPNDNVSDVLFTAFGYRDNLLAP